MNRKKIKKKAFQRGYELNINNPKYLKVLKRFTTDELKYDLGESDITTNSVFGKDKTKTTAIIGSKESGIVAGLEEISWFYKKCGLKIKLFKKDSDSIKKGDILIEIRGYLKKILETERVGLNLLQRMSGIATETNSLVRKTGSELTILSTRKTTLGYLDKKAVYVGGGSTHRLGLWDAILIKDNHLKALKDIGYKDAIGEAVDRAHKSDKTARFIEIEVENKEDAIRAAQKFVELGKGIYVIMLDNMSPDEIRSIVDELKRRKLYNQVLLEASGGITPENIEEYIGLGLDAVSLGYLTHSAKALDMSQEIIYQ